MKQPRRWAVLLAALLLGASLIFAPQTGSAGPAGPMIMPGDPQTLPEIGEPDVPPVGVCRPVFRLPAIIAIVAQTKRVELGVVLVYADLAASNPHVQRSQRGPVRR